jgi:hypothetical protein
VTGHDEAQDLERQILVRTLGDLGADAGAFGGRLGAGLAGMLGGRRGGERGATRAAQRLREDRCELSIELDMAPEEVLSMAAQVLAHEGSVLDDELPSLEHAEVWGLVGVGVGSLNPAVVRVAAIPAGEGASRAVVRATAKEGLIRQSGGQKAAARVRDALLRSSLSRRD